MMLTLVSSELLTVSSLISLCPGHTCKPLHTCLIIFHITLQEAESGASMGKHLDRLGRVTGAAVVQVVESLKDALTCESDGLGSCWYQMYELSFL